MNLTPNYFEMDLAKKADRLTARCFALEEIIREIRRAVEAPKSNEFAIGAVHEITTRALRGEP